MSPKIQPTHICRGAPSIALLSFAMGGTYNLSSRLFLREIISNTLDYGLTGARKFTVDRITTSFRWLYASVRVRTIP